MELTEHILLACFLTNMIIIKPLTFLKFFNPVNIFPTIPGICVGETDPLTDLRCTSQMTNYGIKRPPGVGLAAANRCETLAIVHTAVIADRPGTDPCICIWQKQTDLDSTQCWPHSAHCGAGRGGRLLLSCLTCNLRASVLMHLVDPGCRSRS